MRLMLVRTKMKFGDSVSKLAIVRDFELKMYRKISNTSEEMCCPLTSDVIRDHSMQHGG